MKQKQFNKLVEDSQKLQHQVLVEKGADYQTGVEDVFVNFRVAARIRGKLPTTEALGFMTKQFTSVMMELDRMEDERTECRFTPEQVTEKFGDLHNYLYLIEGMIRSKVMD